MSSISRVAANLNGLVQRLRQSHSTHPVELVAMSHGLWPLSRGIAKMPPADVPLRILVLDSSFNPPTRAHLALINSPRPTDRSPDPTISDGDYDAKLLLLSVRNADKPLGPGDATYAQRLEMMELLAQDVVQRDPESGGLSNVAVAIIDEPKFVEKSATLRSFFRERLSTIAPNPVASEAAPGVPDVRLDFALGFDTLERLISPRYYPSESHMHSAIKQFLSPPPDGDGSFIICARRASSVEQTPEKIRELENSALSSVERMVSSRRVAIIEIGDEEKNFSSSEIRGAIPQTDPTDQTGRPRWKALVTAHVANYIERESLYQQPITT